MKKILSVLAVVAVAATAFAQGTINFANNNATAVQFKFPTVDSPAAPVPANQGWVSLLWAPQGTAATPYSIDKNLAQWLAANPGWAQVQSGGSALTKAITLPGRFLGGVIEVPNANPMDIIVIGWSGTATSFDQAYVQAGANPATATVGMSGKFTIDPEAVGSTTPSPSIVAAGFTGMTLTPAPIPEPSTFALAGLGAAALLIFRRRK